VARTCSRHRFRDARQPSGPGATFTANGATIWYEVRGTASGRPLVMVNGGPGFDHTYVLCSDAWDKLAESRRVVFYDQRGNGRSGALKKGESCTLADQSADLEALRSRLGADRIDLLGHSWGGYLVMAYAARHPEHVAHLIITDSAAPKWSDTEFIFKYIFPEGVDRQGRLDFADALGDTASGKQSLQEYLGMLFVSTEKRDEFLSRASTYHYNRQVNEALNADLAKYDMWPVLATFHARRDQRALRHQRRAQYGVEDPQRHPGSRRKCSSTAGTFLQRARKFAQGRGPRRAGASRARRQRGPGPPRSSRGTPGPVAAPGLWVRFPS
jgi:pimeloyl-ACP methyl ester carboxylesterase